ncbi:MFS transporter [Pseudomaricurvus alkylphenolicus]|jgi:predicted MFS family arabinose efflux permease|uniref:MFS transporter n=1 Tax=Pseudomaricurvus alkylphenolicus TaxID=1306991 RepID=UPI0014243E21|nr:MFS transporter [Pseudomaricurvus alkylphenolicus]NIB42300.1 MFS transporter [Pseudomaricurvus alkylphenolicus]
MNTDAAATRDLQTTTPNDQSLPMAISRICMWVSGQAWVPLLPLLIGAITTKFALDLSTAGFVAAAQILCGAFGAFAMSRLLGKFNARYMAVIAITVAMLGNILAALAPALSLFFLSRVISGLAEGCLMALASGAAAVSTRTEHVFSTYKISFGLYAVIGLLIAPGLITEFELLGGYGLIFGVNVVTLVFAWSAFPKTIGAPQTENTETPRKNSQYSRLFVFALCSAIVLSVVGVMGLQAFIERIGAEVIHLEAQTIGNILAGAAAASILSPLLVMYLVKKGFGRALPFTIAATINIVAVALLGVNGTPLFFVIAALAIMPFVLFTQPYQIGLLADLDPSGKLAAAAPGFFGLGAAIGAPLAGAFSEQFGLINITFLAAALTFVSYLIIVNIARVVDRNTSGGAAESS